MKTPFNRRTVTTGALVAVALLAAAGADAAPKPALPDDLWVGPVYFSWYGVDEQGRPRGQYYGPWLPLDGRMSWDGSVEFHKRHLRHIAAAGFNMIFAVDTFHFRAEQENLFRAVAELRAAGEPAPRVAPYFAAGSFKCRECPKALDRPGGERRFGRVVESWFRRFGRHLGREDLVTLDDGRALIGLWWVPGAERAPEDFFDRIDRRLEAELEIDGFWSVNFTFAGAGPDEINHTFATLDGFEENAAGNVDLTVGYWPPAQIGAESFLARDGGTTYRKAWDRTLKRINRCGATSAPFRITVVSYNELTEGSGIYPAVCSKHQRRARDRHFSGPPSPERCVAAPCHPHRQRDAWAPSCRDSQAPFLYLDISRRKIRRLAKLAAGPCRAGGVR